MREGDESADITSESSSSDDERNDRLPDSESDEDEEVYDEIEDKDIVYNILMQSMYEDF